MNILNLISSWISIVGVLIIIWGVLLVIIGFLNTEYQLFKKHKAHGIDGNVLRRQLGSYILLGLEFMIAGDIIYTVLHPDRDTLTTLAVIVAIRTVISYFLNKELQNVSPTSK